MDDATRTTPTELDWNRMNAAVSRLAAKLDGDLDAIADVSILLDLMEKLINAGATTS